MNPFDTDDYPRGRAVQVVPLVTVTDQETFCFETIHFICGNRDLQGNHVLLFVTLVQNPGCPKRDLFYPST